MNHSVAKNNDARPSFGAEYAAVYVGGAIGTLLRYALVESFGARAEVTLVANVLGCAILGFAVAHRERGWGGDVRMALIGTGFCGGLTTFSTFQFEIWHLIDTGLYVNAVLYVMVSITLGLLAMSGSRRFVHRGRDLA